MAQNRISPDNAKLHAQRAARNASPWIERLGRFGYAAKGVVYVLIGILAAQAAFGLGGETTDTQGALREIAQAPFGQFLIGLVAVGLVGFALWSMVQAIMDTEGKGTDAKGIIRRAGYAGVGVIHIGLAFTALQLMLGTGGDESGEASAKGWTATLLSQPFGQWLVGIVGAITIGIGLHHLYRGYKAGFREELKLSEMSNSEQRWTTLVGQMGYGAIGIIFGIIGTFLIVAAIQAQPEEARGLSGALAALAQQSYGPWLLGVVQGNRITIWAGSPP
jgi:hypothetical protein